MEKYNIQFFWVDAAGQHTEKREFVQIEDAVDQIYKMRRNNNIKQLKYEMVAPDKKVSIKY